MPHRPCKVILCHPATALFLVSAPLLACPFYANAQLHETLKITYSEDLKAHNFGFSVAASGDIAIIGATDDESGSGNRRAYLFNMNTGTELAKFIPPGPPKIDQFGGSVAIYGNTAVVGAYLDDEAYLFDTTTGSLIAKLTDSNASARDYFGISVAINSNTAVVGAFEDDDAGLDSGSAYVFDVNTGNQIAKFTASDTEAGDGFGRSVAISGEVAIVGAYRDDNAGSAYLFDVTTRNQIAKINASDAMADDEFGRSVAISGGTAIVGAPFDDGAEFDSGSAYLFNVTTGSQIAKLTASDATADDRFGWSVAISGNIAIVGARGDAEAGLNSGSAYLFDVTTGNQIAKLTASDAARGDLFGWSVAVSGDNAIVGAWGEDEGNGSAYLFTIPEPASAAALTPTVLALMAGRRRG